MFPNVTALFDMDLETEYQRTQNEEILQAQESIEEGNKAQEKQ